MSAFSIHILGGTHTQTAERRYLDDLLQACLVAETPDALYLLDCGNPAVYELWEQFHGAPDKPIRGIFISHLDPDHVNGLWSLLAEYPKLDCTVALPIPEAELERCRDFVRLLSVPFEPRSRVRFVPMPVGYRFEAGDFLLETLPNAHNSSLKTLPGLRYRPFVEYHPSFSFRVRYGGRTVIYSADYVGPHEIEPWLEAGADLAVLEYGHTLPMETYAARLADYPRVPLIVFTHLWHLRGHPEAVCDVARERLPGKKIVAATAGMEVRFPPDGGEPQIVPFRARLEARRPRRFPSTAEMEAYCRERGIPLEWVVLGPFDNPQRGGEYVGLDQDYGVGPRPDFSREWVGKGGQRVRWQPGPFREIRADGSILLQDLIGGEECVAYAYAQFSVPVSGRYEILASSDDGSRMWVDGREVYYVNRAKPAVQDEERIPIELAAGPHEVLLAVENRFGGWLFYWRIVRAAEADIGKNHAPRR